MSQGFTLFVPETDRLQSFAETLIRKHGFHISEEPFDGDAFTLCWSNGSGKFFNISEKADGSKWIEELIDWDDMAVSTRQLLLGTRVFNFDYTGNTMERQVLQTIIDVLGNRACKCVMNNDWGVLLKLGDVAEALRGNPEWEWKRESFPELPGSPRIAQ